LKADTRGCRILSAEEAKPFLAWGTYNRLLGLLSDSSFSRK
jgi:hypothetical protein